MRRWEWQGISCTLAVTLAAGGLPAGRQAPQGAVCFRLCSWPTLTKVLARELGPRKIRVNSINPGRVDTEGVRAAGIDASDFRKQVESQTPLGGELAVEPLGRIGQPQDIAPAAVFLASSDSAWITGITLYITGGLQ